MSHRLSLLLLSLLLVLPCFSSAFYFHITEGSKKCFIEEVPEDVLVMGKYTSPDHAKLNLNAAGYIDGERYAGIKVTVTDPRQEVLLTHDTTAEGRFGFTSVVGGEHVICIATNTSSWYGQNRNFVSGTQRGTERLDERWDEQDFPRVLLTSVPCRCVCSLRSLVADSA